MAAQSNNLVENIVDTQKKVLDTVVENTKKLTGGNNVLNETIEKGNDWYKNWLETQKSFFNKATSAAEDGKATAETVAKEATSKANDFLTNWMNQQAAWAKQVWDMSQDAAKKSGMGANTNPFAQFPGFNTNSNPFASFMDMHNATNSWTNWMNQFSNNNWMNQAQQFNPFSQDTYKKATEGYTDFINKFQSTLTNNFGEWQKNFENGTVQDAYKNMINTAEGFTKFAELWMPMIKSMQEKTFNMEEYKKMMNPDTYKEFVDKFFGFMPESTREYMNKFTAMANDSFKQMGNSGTAGYQQFRDMMSKFGGNGSQAFGQALSAWNNWQSQLNEAAAPFAKLITPNKYTTAIQEWSDINNRIMEYNIKNAELQYMIYNQGTKVMDKLAEHIAHQVKEGKEVTSIVTLYQEWLNISDKVYVSLFESTDYSKLMAEVASLQMKLRKDIELQTEKMLKDVPVATRSELDEVYKTIYDLKKQVRQLEKMLEIENETEEEKTEEEAPKAAKTNGKKK
jgi:hypothetical protein